MKLGVVGAGNMGGALIRGFSARMADSDEIIVFDPDKAKLSMCYDIDGVTASDSLESLVTQAEIIVLAIKPNMFEEVMPEIAAVSRDKVYVSIAAGVSISFIEDILGQPGKVIRVMPNTPAMVNEGMAAMARSISVTDDEFAQVKRVFESVGKVRDVSEEQMHIITGISGSSPAYAYMYIQALVEKAEDEGLDHETAKLFAAQATLGASKMVMESTDSPEQLRNNVCSPGGTTIEAVNVLTDRGFIDTVAEAVDACVRKSENMEK